MALVNQTLRELAQPTTTDSPLCIVYPILDTNYELRSGAIHLLPHFCGHPYEDPHKHLKEFQLVSATMKPQGVSDEQVKLRLFPFSLKDKAKDWLYDLPSGTITTWEQMARTFLIKFFPAKRASEIRKELVSIQQTDKELFHEYWDRFKRLIASCPHHGLADANLVQYFYEGLTHTDWLMVDALSGGALMNKTAAEANTMLEGMATNSQQFGSRRETPKASVNEVGHSSHLEQQITALTSLVQQALVPPSMVCVVYSMVGHASETCPSVFEQANAMGGY
ncbi:hypothetical protein M0R45_007713 [Rubus argutus]|uniref:Retrotransposon gag domain-containing protein n=1 Tax=Rubus argutus TaxID=59490 RepID=A0AAW1XZ52_RUBAR